MATIYYNDTGSGSWDDYLNWFTDNPTDGSAPVTTYGQVPQDGDTVYCSYYYDVNAGRQTAGWYTGTITMSNSYTFTTLTSYIGDPVNGCGEGITPESSLLWQLSGTISGGTFTGSGWTNSGVIFGGTFTGSGWTNYFSGTISGGTFTGSGWYNNYGGTISGGTFTGSGWYNYQSTISGGTFTGSEWYNYNSGTIFGGTFTNAASCTIGTVTGGYWWESGSMIITDSNNNEYVLVASGTNPGFVNVINTPSSSTDPGIANVLTGVTYTINGTGLTGTFSDTDPGIANVRNGTTYTINGTGLTGSYTPPASTDPGIANVLTGVTYTINGSGLTGTFSDTDPGIANVRNGTTYTFAGTGMTGNLVVPSAGQVETGVTFDANNSVTGTYDPVTGNYSDPGIANVLNGTTYTFAGTGMTGNVVGPSTSQVQAGVTFGSSSSLTGTYDPVTGNYSDPGIANVRNGTTYTFAGTGMTGNVVVPSAGQVETGVTFDTNNSVTGTYAGSDVWDVALSTFTDPTKAGGALANINAKVSLLGLLPTNILPTQYTANTQNVAATIIQGDDYTSEVGAITFNSANWIDLTGTGTVVTMTAVTADTAELQVLRVVGSVTSASGVQTLTFQPTHTDTSTVPIGTHNMSVSATLSDATIKTLILGTLTVEDSYSK